MKTLLDIANENNCKSIVDLSPLLLNRKVKTIGVNRSGHKLKNKFTITGINPTYAGNGGIGASTAISVTTEYSGTYSSGIYLNELVFDSVSVTDLKENFDKLESEKNKIEQQIKICTDLNLTNFDQTLIDIISVLNEFKKDEKSDDILKYAEQILKLTSN